MLKILTLVGTRPEIIKLSSIIKRLDKHFDHILIHTGQNYDHELSDIFFKDLQLREPNEYLKIATGNVSYDIANIISKTDDVLEKYKPDAFLILGDTNSCLSAIIAKRRKIPIFHIEAGNRCFDQNVPEEINRKIVDHISDFNLTYSQIAKNYLISEGCNPQQTICIGSPMKEVLLDTKKNIDASDILQKLGLIKNNYFVFSCHREENIEKVEKLKKMEVILKLLDEKFNLPIIFSLHPRTKKKLQKHFNLNEINNLRLVKPLSFSDYIQLQRNSNCVMSDSGTLTEEASLLGFNAINLRDVHERPEGDENGTTIVCGFNQQKILSALNLFSCFKTQKPKSVLDYEVEDVSYKVLKLILSYTSYVNERIWKK